MVALRTTAWMTAESVNPRISAQVISQVIEPVIVNACLIAPIALPPPGRYPIPVTGIRRGRNDGRGDPRTARDAAVHGARRAVPDARADRRRGRRVPRHGEWHGDGA